jgi:predicted nucleotidyltransferase component of viral defense system
MKNLNSLPTETKEVFIALSNAEFLNEYIFVGGSALSVYLNHRKSEDIDLFTWNKTIDNKLILETIKKLFGDNFTIENISNTQLDLKVNNVKLTFFANNWNKLEKTEPLLNNINIATLELLTAMKLNTLFLRAKFRDYYDLYVINKDVYSIEQMYEIIKNYMPQINQKLFQMALIFIDDIEDDNIKYLEPKFNVEIKQIRTHFEKKLNEFYKNKNITK